MQQAGYQNIHLYERDEHFHALKDGHGLTLTYNNPKKTSITAPLAKLGILERVARMDCPLRSPYVFNQSGRILGYYGNAFFGGSSDGANHDSFRGCGQRGNLRVPRQCLRKIMMDALMERDIVVDDGNEKGEKEDQKKGFVNIHWGKKFTSFYHQHQHQEHQHQQPGTKDFDDDTTSIATSVSSATTSASSATTSSPVSFGTFNLEDGSTETVDLLIGADGVRSRVMEQLLSSSSSSPPKQQAKQQAKQQVKQLSTLNNNH